MEPPKVTQAELAGLVAEAVAWIEEQRDKYHPLSDPLSGSVKVKLRPFFPEEILDRLRIKHVSLTGETIPYPPFYERVRAGGSRVVPDAAHMTAMPFRMSLCSIENRRCERYFTPWYTSRNFLS